jgi:SAM-dependent methyltransferase
MREAILEILREPRTGARLTLTATRHDGPSIEEGVLTSEDTGIAYPIRRGIPRFVKDDGYTDNFGKQWNLFRITQLDSSTGAPLSERRFDAEAGWTQADLDGKLVLDAGCGAGRFAEIAAARGARLVALDMSSAVDAARDTLSRFPGAEVVQASLFEPPFLPRSFDFAYSIGVIQHTPDPPRGIESVLHYVKEGGQFAFTIYARRPWTKLNAKYLVRPVTRRLPNDLLLHGIERAMPVLFPLADRLFRLPVVGKLSRFLIPVAVYVDRQELTRDQRYQEAVLDTFDMLSPRFDSPMIWQEVETALRKARARSWNFRSRVPLVLTGTC